MRYRKLDPNGDYIIGKTDEMCEGTAAVAQAVKTRILLLLGEWWEAPSDGTPLFEKVFGQKMRVDKPPDEIDLVFSERINGTKGVKEISEYKSIVDSERRAYSAEITIKTEFDTEFTVTIESGANAILVNI